MRVEGGKEGFKGWGLPFLLLMAAAYLVFGNTFHNTWTFDDFPVVLNNPDIRSFWDFWHNFRGGRPLRELSLLLDHALFGLDPVGYHIQNIFWHGLNAGLIFLLVFRLGKRRILAWVASLLFLVHPIQVEVVANVSNRKDSLALAFCLLSLLAYMESFQPGARRPLWIAVSLGSFLVGLLAKENALVCPILLMGYEVSFLPREKRLLMRRVRPWAVLVASGVILFFFWYFFLGGRAGFLAAAQTKLGHFNYFQQPSESVYYRMVLKSWAFMLLKLILPHNLAPEYMFSVPGSWMDPWIISAMGILLMYIASLFLSKRRHPLAFFGLLWLGVFWLPTSNLWPFSVFVADRYLYAPSLGVYVLFAWLLTEVGRPTRFAWVTALALVLFLSAMTWRQNHAWRSPYTLWSHTVKISPQSCTALNNLGRVYLAQKKYSQAVPLFLKASEVNPYIADPFYNLGQAYEKMGEWQKALEPYKAFLALDVPVYRFQAQILKERFKKRYGIGLSGE